MRLPAFAVFITVFLLIYLSVNLYIFFKGRKIVHRWPSLKWPYAITFFLVAGSFIIGRIMEEVSLCTLTDVFIWTGSYWFAFMLYFFIAGLLFDLVRFVHRLTNFIPESLAEAYRSKRHFVIIGVILIVCATVAGGSINAASPVVKKIDLKLNNGKVLKQPVKIALVTDIHLGRIIKNSRLEKMVAMVNSQKPDIILLSGDIVDEDIAPVISNGLGKTLAGLESAHGVYAVTGNHEYIGGAEPAVKYLSQYGINFLRDSAVKINNSIYIAGREDKSVTRFTKTQRVPLKKILEGTDKKIPVVLMDHQPVNIDEVVKEEVDLMVSGHTHDGQMWPINYITGMFFKASFGYYTFDKTRVYVSNGFGTWGPPVRIGNTPEIVLINITGPEE